MAVISIWVTDQVELLVKFIGYYTPRTPTTRDEDVSICYATASEPLERIYTVAFARQLYTKSLGLVSPRDVRASDSSRLSDRLS